jgi:hypothetical protein
LKEQFVIATRNDYATGVAQSDNPKVALVAMKRTFGA